MLVDPRGRVDDELHARLVDTDAGERGDDGRVGVLRIVARGLARRAVVEDVRLGERRDIEQLLGRRALPGRRRLDDLMEGLVEAMYAEATPLERTLDLSADPTAAQTGTAGFGR